MKKLVSLNKRFTERRLTRIANWPSVRMLSPGWVKKLLVLAIVSSTWIFLYSITPGLTATLQDAVQLRFYSALVMLLSFGLLRQSVKRITSLPDEYLDEREIENRDWAYKLGYLVVRRVGLAVVLALGGLSLVFFLFARSQGELGVLFQTAAFSANDFKNVANDFVKTYFAIDPLFALFVLLGLLTFTAYSFPVILLGWRESKHTQIVDPENNHGLEFTLLSKGYFRRLITALGAFVIALVAVRVLPVPDVWGNLFIISIYYAIYVYFWGLFNQIEALQIERDLVKAQPGFAKHYRISFWLLVSAGLVGLLVPVSLFMAIAQMQPINFLPFGAGLALLGIHIASYFRISRLGKTTT